MIRDHPRSRGEHWKAAGIRALRTGSSPLTRGAHRREVGQRARPRIIPAHAGSTVCDWRVLEGVGDHPRSRGEHAAAAAGSAGSAGSSPLTRGARTPGHRAVDRQRIIPAHAGSTTAFKAPSLQARDHPRSRGEHPSGVEVAAFLDGSSPLTRGAPNGTDQDSHA